MTRAIDYPDDDDGLYAARQRADKVSAQPGHTRNKGFRFSASGLFLGLLGLAVFASAIGVVYAKHESRKLFIELQTLQTTRDEMNVEWGQLQLEQSTLATHARIDAVARTKLDMITPAPETVVIVKP
jgi:cell division protein FtsL